MSTTVKAGLVVGGLLILLAIVLFLVLGGKTSEDKGNSTENQQVVEQVTEEETEKRVQESNVNNDNVETSAQSAMLKIDEDSLNGLTAKQFSEVGYVASKNIYLQDDQLYYVLGVMLANNKVVNYYVSESGYYLLSVNDKVSISYTLYTNANGLSFIQVASVTTID